MSLTTWLGNDIISSRMLGDTLVVAQKLYGKPGFYHRVFPLKYQIIISTSWAWWCLGEWICSGLQALFHLALLNTGRGFSFFCSWIAGHCYLMSACWKSQGESGLLVSLPSSKALPLCLLLPSSWPLWEQFTALCGLGGIACQLPAFSWCLF